jgi:perosamine synthetase
MDKGIRIKLADPGITSSDMEAAFKVLESGHLVNGPKAAAFEQALQERTLRKNAVVLSSGTAALLASMKALGIGQESTVVVPGFTFPAPAAAAAFLGANVLVCDVDHKTFCISPATLEPLLDEDISLVVAIDQFGMPAPTPDIEDMLSSRGIPVLVDAACSLGSHLDGQPCGSFGTAAILSFHPRKVITTSEGGAVLTNYEQITSRVRQISNHGIKDGTFASIGLNLRLSEIGASLGLSQLGRLDAIVERRRALADRYREALPLTFQQPPPGAITNYQTLVAVLPASLDAARRALLFDALRQEGIEATIASYCLAEIPTMHKRFGIDPIETPVALSLHERAMALPLHPGLSDEDVEEVIDVIRSWLYKYGIF